jgi:hypothetical protein
MSALLLEAHSQFFCFLCVFQIQLALLTGLDLRELFSIVAFYVAGITGVNHHTQL